MSHQRRGARLTGRRPWDSAAMAELAQTAIAAMTQRAMERGEGVDDRPLKPYSTKPTYISRKAFPKPRGGVATQAQGRTATGRRRTARGRTVYYPGGYAEYKAAIAGNKRVNLTRTGRMRRSFRVKRLRKLIATIGLSGTPAVYGQFVNRERPWIGLSAKDKAVLRAALPGIVERVLERQNRRRGGAS